MPTIKTSYSEEINIIDMTVDEFLAISLKAIELRMWKIGSVSSSNITASTTLAPDSPGELIEITIKGNDKAHITSSSEGIDLPADNRNKENIDNFIDTLDEIIAEISPKETGKLIDNYRIYIKEELENEEEAQEQENEGVSLSNIISLFNPVEGYFVTPILLMINIAVFIFMIFSDIANIIAPDVETLIKWGANYQPAVVSGQYYRLLTSCFIHVGFIHLVFNMWALVIIGGALEGFIGKFRFLSAYLIAGIFSNIVSNEYNHEIVTAGASGAIMGLFGVFLALSSLKTLSKSVSKTFIVSVTLFIAYNLIAGMMNKSINLTSHVSGLFAGLITGMAYYPTVKIPKPRGLKYGVVFLLFCLIIILAGSQANIRFSDLSAMDEPVTLQSNFDRYNSGIFQLKLIDFLQNENKAFNIIESRKNISRKNFLQAMKDSAFYYWNENMMLLDELNKFNWNDDYRNITQDLTDYCGYQRKFYELLYWKVREDTDRYDSLLKYYRDQSEEKALHINRVHGS